MSAKLEACFAEKSKEILLPPRKVISDFVLPLAGSSDDRDGSANDFRCFRSMSDEITNFWSNLHKTLVELYEMGRSDPRKVAFAAKVSLALAIVSLAIFFKEPLKDINQYAIWVTLKSF